MWLLTESNQSYFLHQNLKRLDAVKLDAVKKDIGNKTMFDFVNREKQEKTIEIPVLPLRDVVVFPHMIVPLFVGRGKSIAALESAMKYEKEIFLIAQKNPKKDDPAEDDHVVDVFEPGYRYQGVLLRPARIRVKKFEA